MNKNKMGKSFIFPDSLILAIGYIYYSFLLPYRQTEGMIKATGKSLPEKPSSYSHICKRSNVDIRNNNRSASDDDNDDDDHIVISVDSNGAKVTNRGQCMDEKWNVQNTKGYLKIHLAVNIKTKEILALEVTDEKVQDGKMLKKLVDTVLNIASTTNHMIHHTFLGDGAFDSNSNFQYLEVKKKIIPRIKVRKNSVVSPENDELRNKEVIRQQTKEDLHKWKKKRMYGHRWMAKETAFSTQKSTFGEYVSATKFKNLVKEMMIKVSLYNLFGRI